MKTLKSIRLTMTEGSSDKEYRIHLVEKTASEYLVNFQNGRRNGTLTNKTKTETPVSKEEAEKIFEKLLKEKTRGGYLVDGENTTGAVAVIPKEKNATLVQLLKEVSDSTSLTQFINNPQWVMQKKYDGERRTLNKTKSNCVGGNKKAETVSLPETIVQSISQESDIELDAEIIGETLFVFDVLRHKEKDLRNKTYKERLGILSKIKFGEYIKVVATAVSREEKVAMLEQMRNDKAEGIVIKKIDAPYSVGRESGSALKHKFYKTATVKVSAITKGKRSVQMAMKTSEGFVDVGAVTIPPNKNIPKVNDFIEVRYLYAYKGGSLFQPTFLFNRTDVDDSDTSIEQLSYKQEECDDITI